MIEIKSIEDCKQVTNPAHNAVVTGILKSWMEDQASVVDFEGGKYPWKAEDNGHIVYIERMSDCDKITDLTEEEFCRWEAVAYFHAEGIYEIIVLHNNEFGIGYFIPKENVSDRLEAHMARETNLFTEITIYQTLADRLGEV